MQNDITELNNFCAPIYKVDRSSPDYQIAWGLFVWLGWVVEGRRSDFISHRFNAFCSILHTINANKDYVFHTDLNNASYAVRSWPISYSPVVETIKRLVEIEWIVRHKPTVENYIEYARMCDLTLCLLRSGKLCISLSTAPNCTTTALTYSIGPVSKSESWYRA